MTGALHAARMVSLLGVCMCVALMASAQDIPCTVSQGGGLTNYSVPEYEATGCQYSWANGTSYVMANHEAEMKTLVLTQNSLKLVMRKCVEQVVYTRDCISDGISCHATCTTNCSENAGEPHNEKGIRLHVCITLFATFLLLLLGLFLAIRYEKCCRVKTGEDVETPSE